VPRKQDEEITLRRPPLVDLTEGGGSSTARSEDAARLQRLAEASVALSAPLSVAEIIDRVTSQAREIIGAHQAISRLMAGADPQQPLEAMSVSAEREPPEPAEIAQQHRLCNVVCDSNRPLRLAKAGPAEGRTGRAHTQQADPPLRGLLAAPMVAGDGGNIGVVELTDRYAGDFTAEDEAVLVQLARLASIAVENARLFEREQATARGLQRQLLPRSLPDLDGLQAAARYMAGGQGLEVGGDWYDVLDLGDHRVALVIGDVMGRGVHAASVMGQLRIALRAYALEGLRPSDALAALGRLVDTMEGEYFVTALSAEWNLQTNTLTFANAGHPPPLLRLADGTVRYLRGTQGVPIGVDPSPSYVEHRVDAPPGSDVLLYTDGLVEHRDLSLDATLETLARATATAPASAEAAAQHVLNAMPPVDGDDVALLIARRPGGSGPSDPPVRDRGDELWLAAFPTNVSHARRWITRQMGVCGAREAIDVVVLLTSEIVTNAIVHAGTPLTLRVDTEGERVRIAVSDGAPQVPAMGEFDLHSAGGRGMALLDTLADDWGVQVEPDGKTVWFDVTPDQPDAE
jgi:serine phosphatase RsbU (regulator of sigma subunit)/anti-sigma regulatory factor (Ser/Thr protein kinase)